MQLWGAAGDMGASGAGVIQADASVVTGLRQQGRLGSRAQERRAQEGKGQSQGRTRRAPPTSSSSPLLTLHLKIRGIIYPADKARALPPFLVRVPPTGRDQAHGRT